MLILQRCEYLQLPLKALKLVLQAGHFQLQLPLYSPQLTHLLLSLSLLTCNLLNLSAQLLCLHTQQTATQIVERTAANGSSAEAAECSQSICSSAWLMLTWEASRQLR